MANAATYTFRDDAREVARLSFFSDEQGAQVALYATSGVGAVLACVFMSEVSGMAGLRRPPKLDMAMGHYDVNSPVERLAFLLSGWFNSELRSRIWHHIAQPRPALPEPAAHEVPALCQEARIVADFDLTYDAMKRRGDVQNIDDWLRNRGVFISDRQFRTWRKRWGRPFR